MIDDKLNKEWKYLNNFIDSLSDDHIKKSYLISFLTESEDIDFYNALNKFQENQDNLFYYSIPEQNFYIVAAGESLSLTFDNVEKLNQFSDQFSVLKNGILHNFDDLNYYPPVFFFAIKFPSKKSAEEWKDFKPVKLFIPELILIKSGDQTYQVTNFNSESLNSRYDLRQRLLSQKKQTEINESSSRTSNQKTNIKLSNMQSFDEWKVKVDHLLERINTKEFDKVVLSRNTVFNLYGNTKTNDLAFLLDKNYPECFNFIYKSNDALFFSASPEKLFILENGIIHTEALAGSIERGRNDSEDKNLENTLTTSSKDIDEHEFVINHLKTVLGKYCVDIDIDSIPSLKKLSNIQHLHTGLSGRIKNGFDIFSIIKDIFPTPAVGGYPIISTLNVIEEIEDFDRGLFTGFMGWMNLKNDGEFIVAIRSGLIHKNKLYVYAGCGIVPGSDALKEFEETQLKAESIISLFDYENKS